MHLSSFVVGCAARMHALSCMVVLAWHWEPTVAQEAAKSKYKL